MSRYQIQILSFFAILAIALLGMKGFAKRPEVATISAINDPQSLLSADVPIATSSGDTAAFSSPEPQSATLNANTAQFNKPLFTRVDSTPTPMGSAEEILVADLQSGEKYFTNFSSKRWPIASLSKLMTATIVYANLNLDATATIAQADMADGDNSGFAPGETYRLRDLLKVMLVASKNTAANVLARSYGLEQFFALMNAKAKDWGMNDTYFEDPSGLSIANQSTGEDLLKMVRGISVERPDIWKTTENAKVTIKELNSGKLRSFTSTNQFVNRKDFYGGKTGYTPEADGNLISVFLYGKRTVVIIVLGSSDRFGETENIYNWFTHDFKPSN